MEEVKKILNKYGYRCSFQPLHKNTIILKYSKKKDAVSSERFLTFLTPTGLVIGRLFNIKSERDKLSSEDLKEIIGIFSLYRIPHAKKIIADIENIAF